MIKVIVGEPKPYGIELPFPKLMKHTDGDIYLFLSNKVGIGMTNESGEMFCQVPLTILEGIGMSDFTDYNLPITLQNDVNE